MSQLPAGVATDISTNFSKSVAILQWSLHPSPIEYVLHERQTIHLFSYPLAFLFLVVQKKQIGADSSEARDVRGNSSYGRRDGEENLAAVAHG